MGALLSPVVIASFLDAAAADASVTHRIGPPYWLFAAFTALAGVLVAMSRSPLMTDWLPSPRPIVVATKGYQDDVDVDDGTSWQRGDNVVSTARDCSADTGTC